VSGDAAATVHNIQANELLYRAGLAAHMIPIVCNVALIVILYELFKVVDRRIALMMVFYSLVGTAVEGANLLDQFTPLVLLDGAQQSNALRADRVQDLVYAPVRLVSIGYDIQQVIYAFYLLCAGYLVFRSIFVPRVIGASAGDRGVGLPVLQLRELPFTCVRVASGAAHPAARAGWGSIPLPLASGDRRERETLAGAGQRGAHRLGLHALGGARLIAVATG
jgi:Domain of unknown function (DUF4386)